jgi:hypothetical protein
MAATSGVPDVDMSLPEVGNDTLLAGHEGRYNKKAAPMRGLQRFSDLLV